MAEGEKTHAAVRHVNGDSLLHNVFDSQTHQNTIRQNKYYLIHAMEGYNSCTLPQTQ